MTRAKRAGSETPAAKVGRRIRERREALGLSQAEVARAAGIDFATFSKLENGKSGSRGPTLARLYQVAEVLRVPPSQLLDA